ncbi:hypothetical protein KKD19_03540 [Patescibacteria group bacterium]|nr:hypothetical protein [Patescibacteria group bacterium]MBU4512287.1 hypothetical protein [Patescibacteria group bacterium]MCG2693641.1 hypothetical protein [Candidatus Parcubacteria bacterium]
MVINKKSENHYGFIFFKIAFFVIVSIIALVFVGNQAHAAGNTTGYAWGENAGWIKFNPTNGGVTVPVGAGSVTGYAWGENIGWLKMDPVNGGASKDASGNLTGYIWAENGGWISFNPANGGVTINGDGNWLGYAWGENIGWIKFNPLNGGVYSDLSTLCTTHNLSGWAWSSNAGWVSLSCWNTGEGQAGPDYGLDIDHNNHKIYGWAWSSNFGWICFGSTCSEYGTPPSGVLEVNYDFNTGEVSGWGKVIALGDDGWLKMRKETGDAGADYGVTLHKDLTLTGWAWNGNDSPGLGIGWLKFSAQVSGAPECNDGIDNDADGECDFNGCDGLLPDRCCFSPNDPSEFCLGRGPWVETLYRDIYSKGEISSLFVPQLQQGFNASFMILADGSIRNWSSKGWVEQTGTLGSDWLKGNLPINQQTGFPSESDGVYYSNVGQIDYIGLITNIGGSKNKYGNGIKTDNLSPLKNGPLNNYVYHITSDLSFPPDNNELAFDNDSGIAIIVIDGNLNLTATTTYDNTVISDITDLAAITWIIRGDLIIKPNTTIDGVGTIGDRVGVVGNFIVLGDGDPAVCPALDQPSNGCGRVSTGTTGNNDDRLIVQGLIIARQFKFERRYFDEAGNPAEQIIFDNRLFANPPQGMRDFLKTLPGWQATAP